MAGVESGTHFGRQAGTPPAGGGAGAHGIVAILRPSDIEQAWSYAERQIADAAAEMGVDVESTTIGSTEALVLPAAAPAADSDSDQDDGAYGMDHGMAGHGMYGHGGFAAARAGDFIVAGMTAADLTDVIAVADGSGQSLADSAEAQAVAAALPAEALSFTYVDGQGILDALDPEAIAMLQSVMMETPVELLASQTGLAISADDPGFRFDTVTILNDAVDPAPYTVENDPAVANAAERAPAGTFAFLAGRLAPNTFDGSAFAVAQAVNAAESGESMPADEAGMTFPTDEEMASEIATASATLGFHLQTELFDLLGDDFIAFTTFPAISMDEFGIDAAAAITTTDPAALAETMAKIAAWIDRSPESGVDISARQVDGSPVYVAASEEMAGAPGLEFGVVADQAVLGSGGGIDALLAAPATSLADDEQFQDVMALLPDAYYQVGYLDIGQAIDPVLNLVGIFESLGEDGATSAATPMAAVDDLRNLRALGAVAYQEGNVSGSSAILYIGG
jgi:hypothetical protein